jgi:hypothetical protein
MVALVPFLDLRFGLKDMSDVETRLFCAKWRFSVQFLQPESGGVAARATHVNLL